MEIINQNDWFVEIIYKPNKDGSAIQKKLIKTLEKVCDDTNFYFREFSILKRYLDNYGIKKAITKGLSLHISWMGSILEIENACVNFKKIIEIQMKKFNNYIKEYEIYFASELENYKINNRSD